MTAKIKICRIVDLETSIRLVNQRVDFLGFHIIEASDLSLLNRYEEINAYLMETLGFFGAVLVTKIASVDVLENTILKSNFNYIQLHYIQDSSVQNLLKNFSKTKNFISIYDPKLADKTHFRRLHTFSKYIIIDHAEGGTGKRTEFDAKLLDGFDNILLAGGINLNNIKELNEQFHPFGFDIQTAAEITKGVKDFEYILKMQNALL
jgi:phosphoribosylanthranilate isomerase